MVAPGARGLRFAGLFVVVSACGGSPSGDAVDGNDNLADATSEGEAGPEEGETDAHGAGDSPVEDATDLPFVSACGNGLLEDGEECDDGNRIDGDDCDWNCRTGPGEPPGPPDPSAAPFEPEGEVASLEGIALGDVIEFLGMPIPLVWNGVSLATVLRESVDAGASMRVRFHRFWSDGSAVGPDWLYAADGWSFGWLDLVWTGGGYGLFFSRVDVGACLQRLEADGKPFGAPIVMVPDGFGSEADRIDGGYVAQYRTASGVLEIGRFDDDGSPVAPGLPLCTEGRKWSNVAARSSGFVSLGECWDLDLPHGPSTLGLFLVSPEADRISGIEWLDASMAGGDVGRTADGFYAAWERWPMPAAGRQTCIARFGPDGRLLRSPRCSLLHPFDGGPTSVEAGGVRADRDEHGLGLLFVGTNDTPAAPCTDRLMFLRTDADGRAVGEPVNVLGLDAAGRFDGFNIAWAGDSYVVLVKVAECVSPDATGYPPGLYVRRFVPVSP